MSLSESGDGSPTPLWDFAFQSLAGAEAAADGDLLASCSALYSAEYGRWAIGSELGGQPIRMSVQRLRELLSGADAWLASAYSGGELVGYCAALWFDLADRGRVAWVTQLVVAETYRSLSVATNLLYAVWGFSDFYAWGLATANPLAVRALETATRRPCSAAAIRRGGGELFTELARHVSYLPDQLAVGADGSALPIVDTKFYVDHSKLPAMRRQAARPDRPWALGSIDEGQEWFACTFRDQQPSAPTAEQLHQLLRGSDDVWMSAYERMTLTPEHRWHEHATSEIQFAVSASALPVGARVLDVGCGDGRHATELANLGFDVTAVEISDALISRAAKDVVGPIQWRVMDARVHLPAGPFDLVLCLYDVLGSSASPDDDLALLSNIWRSLVPGGWLALSVMNADATDGDIPILQRPTEGRDFVRALEALRPSSTMEMSGAIFDPDLLVLYDGVRYRKEQFAGTPGRLPQELLVRDKRYTADELSRTLVAVGYDVVSVRPSELGRWAQAIDRANPKAKELVALGRRARGPGPQLRRGKRQ